MEKSQLIFLLVVCGTICILASLGAIGYLYDKHAAELSMPDSGQDIPPDARFMIFVGLPSLLAFVAGTVMVGIGIKISRDDDRP